MGPEAHLESDTLRLEGSVPNLLDSDSQGQLVYSWSEINQNILEDDNIAAYLLTGSTELPNLVLAPGLLQSGRKYAFQLSVTTENGVSGSAVILVSVVGGPAISSFDTVLLDPSTGVYCSFSLIRA